VRAAYTYFASCGALYYPALLSPLCSSRTLTAKAIQRRIMQAMETELVPFVLACIFLLVYTNICRGLMKQSRGGSPLEIRITYATHVITTNRTTEEDTIPSFNATVSSLDTNQYTLVRLSKAGDGNILNVLDTKIGTVNELLRVEELNDGLWEMVVLKSYCSTLQAMLGEIFPGSNVDLNHDPTEPTVSEVEILGYNAAKMLCEHLFIKRAERMVKEGWSMAADFYDYLRARINGRWRTRSHL